MLLAEGMATLHPMPLLALLAVAALGAVAAVLARRRVRTPRVLEIVETTSLGGRRALVVARLNGEILLLGSSEAGVALLASRPAPAGPPEPKFDDLLAESADDEQLRRKLARGRAARVQ
jgi:flagellar protein FliO/FliZ